jgi:hypothetical protein
MMGYADYEGMFGNFGKFLGVKKLSLEKMFPFAVNICTTSRPFGSPYKNRTTIILGRQVGLEGGGGGACRRK